MSTRTSSDQRYMEWRIRETSKGWAKTPRGKVICPECGADGYAGGTWTHAHLDHTECDCGKIVTQRGFRTHLASHRRRR